MVDPASPAGVATNLVGSGPPRTKRIFLGWEKPFLPEATRWLSTQSSSHDYLELSHLTVVATGQRILRLLEEHLAQAALDSILSPPTLATTASLYQHLELSGSRMASRQESLMLWCQALHNREIAEAGLQEKLGLKSPQLLDRALFLRDLYEQLSAVGTNPRESCIEIQNQHWSTDDSRWEAVESLFEDFQNSLSGRGFCDSWTVLDHLTPQSLPGPVVLLGIAELKPIVRRLFTAAQTRVVSLILAPESEAANFDSFGCVVVDAWQNREAQIADEQIIFCADQEQQRLALLKAISSFATDFTRDNITLVDLNPQTAITNAALLEEHGIPAHAPQTITLADTEAAQALLSGSRYAHSGSYFDFETLLRMPLVAHYVVKKSGGNIADREALLSMLDVFRNRHFPAIISPLSSLPRNAEEPFLVAYNLVNDLVSPLSSLQRGLRYQAFSQTLEKLLEDSDIGQIESEYFEELLTALREAIESAELFEAELSLEEFLSLVSEGMAQRAAPQEGDTTHALEVVGWLEAALDPADAVVFANCNEGLLPAAFVSHPWLPNSLCEKLALPSSAARVARDIFLLTAMQHSKKALRFCAARLAAEGEPLLASKLLLQSPALTQRVQSFFNEDLSLILKSRQNPTPFSRSIDYQALIPHYDVPYRLPMSSLSRYAQCPFLFFLTNVARIEAVDTEGSELDSATFGTFIHAVLQDFGNSELTEIGDETTLGKFLQTRAHVRFQDQFGEFPTAATRLQYHQFLDRLRNFAQWQAERSQQGWKILHSEVDAELTITLGQEEYSLRGRIDRVDRHPGSGAICIIDYKTWDKSAASTKILSAKNGWNDLQLPLYALALKASQDLSASQVAILPLTAAESGLSLTAIDTSEELLDMAKAQALEILKSIQKKEFWPPRIKADAAGEFASIYRGALAHG